MASSKNYLIQLVADHKIGCRKKSSVNDLIHILRVAGIEFDHTKVITKSQLWDLARKHGVSVPQSASRERLIKELVNSNPPVIIQLPESVKKSNAVVVKQKQVGGNLTSRLPTLSYEAAKMLHENALQFPESHYPPWLKEALDWMICLYCDDSLGQAGKGDHVNSVMLKGLPRQISNFSKFTIPCCSTCNSSKAGKPYLKYIESLNLSDERRTLLKNIDLFIKKHEHFYHTDYDQFAKLKLRMKQDLEDYKQIVLSMQVIAFTQIPYPDEDEHDDQ